MSEDRPVEETTAASAGSESSTTAPKSKGGPLSWLLFVVGVLVVAAIAMTIAGYFLPREFEAETSIYLDRPPQVAFQKINDLRAWQEWCPWNEETLPGIKNEYTGPEAGVGATWSWTHESGNGKQWITVVEPNLEIEFATEFADMKPMTSIISFRPEKEGTRITWKSHGEVNDGPYWGWLGLMAPSMMASEYQQGLQKLVDIVEAEQPPGGEYPEIKPSSGPSPTASSVIEGGDGPMPMGAGAGQTPGTGAESSTDSESNTTGGDEGAETTEADKSDEAGSNESQDDGAGESDSDNS